MTKIKLYLATILVVFITFPIPAQAGSESDPKPIKNNQQAQTTEMTRLVNRLEEIKGMDRSALSSTERKELRKEVRGIKEEIAISNGGVYLSVGAVIIIVLLLILLL